ncbi:hypothetical protein H8E77_31590 [bacterium]|nr:hypothetical protein [bacterium]
MSTPLDEKQSRRDFLRDSVRYLTLGGLLIMGGALFARRSSSSKEEKCTNNLGVCRSCPSLKSCDLAND